MNQRPDNMAHGEGTGERMEHTTEPPAAGSKPDVSAGLADELNSAALVEIARNYFAEAFPPVTRPDTQEACPAPEQLQASARSGQLPDDQLRAHLFNCSSCFTNYRAALTARQAQVAATSSAAAAVAASVREPVRKPAPRWFLNGLLDRWRALTWSGWQVAGVASALLLLVAGSWWAVTARRANLAANEMTKADAPLTQASPDLAARTSLPLSPGQTGSATVQPSHGGIPPLNPGQAASPSAPLGASVTKSPFPPRSQPAAAATEPVPTSPRVAGALVEVDLNEFLALRAVRPGAEATARQIELQAQATRLQLRLPEGSTRGHYRVAWLDEAGRTVLSAPAQSTDGQALRVVFALQTLPPGHWRLRLTTRGEAPTDFPVLLKPLSQ